MASSTNYFLGSDREMEKQVETYAKDDQLNNEYAESSTNIQNKRCGPNISIQDVKLSNNLRDSKGRRDHDHAQAATSSATRINANTSADIDVGDYSSFRETHKYYYIDATRKGPNPGDRKAGLEQRLDSNHRTSADGASYQRLGQTSSYYKHATKYGFDRYGPRYDPYQTSSKERLGISTDQGLLSSKQTDSTKNTTSETGLTKRVSKDEFFHKCKSPPGGSVSDSNSRSKKSKYYRSKRSSSTYSTSGKEQKREPKRRSTSTRTRKAKDITREKKHGKPNERSLHYQYSAFDMVDMGPPNYHGSFENIGGYVSYNPYGGVHAYGASWMFHQPQRQKSGKKML